MNHYSFFTKGTILYFTNVILLFLKRFDFQQVVRSEKVRCKRL